MYLKRLLTLVVLIGAVGGIWFMYYFYKVVVAPNTNFTENGVEIFIKTDTDFNQLLRQLTPLLKNRKSFEQLAQKKRYAANVRAGRYYLERDMSNNDIINTLRTGNKPVRVSFNNTDRLEKLAGKVSKRIEADSVALLEQFTNPTFLKTNGFTEAGALSMYLPNTYEFYWNTSAAEFVHRMLKEYKKYWTEERKEQAAQLNLTPRQVHVLASIVHMESKKPDEHARIAGVYLNRLEKKMLLQADPTVIYALKKHLNNYDTIIKRVLYRDLELDSPYNTYKNAGLPPGPIAMPDLTAVNAVLHPEQHDYIYFVADVKRPGYHKFARTLNGHLENKKAYIRWLKKQNIRR